MTPSSKSSPLADLTRLTPTTFLHHPNSHTASSPTILLHTWMNASPTHIHFYFRKWTELFPTARIVVILGTVPNVVYIPTSTQKRLLGPVLSALRAEPESPIYMHLFSNSGAHSASVLLRAFKETSMDGCGILPVKGMLFDSTPSRGTYNSAYAGMSYLIPRYPLFLRYLGLAFVHFLVCLALIISKTSGKMNVLNQSNHDMNDSSLVSEDTPRVYFYSEEDLLVKWQDVEYHAAVAESKGWVVRSEKFVGTDHCRHGKGEGEARYWAAAERMVNRPSPQNG